MTLEQRLTELGIELPQVSTPMANYVGAQVDGDVVYLSGHIARRDGAPFAGRVGADVDTDVARLAARDVAIDMLATLQQAVGLDAIKKVLKICGYIRSAPGFDQQPAVLNGASDLLVEVFGEAVGKHARAAVGVSELPGGAVLEIDGVFRI